MKKSKKIYWLIPLILILLAGAYVLSPIYNIRKIKVESESIGTAKKVAEASGLREGENILIALLERGNIFTMRFTEAELKLNEAFPGFEKISVSAKLPSEVEITYETRQPAFEIEYGDIYLVTDISGCMLQSRHEHETGLLRLKGVDVTGFTVGCVPGDGDTFEKAAAIYSEMTWFDTENLTAFREYVEWVDFSMVNTIALMYDGRVLVKMDRDGDVSYQTASMCVILSQKIGSGETGILDFTAGENPVFTTE